MRRAGVVGLAIARQLALEGYRVTILDAAPQAGAAAADPSSARHHIGYRHGADPMPLVEERQSRRKNC